MTDSPIDTTSHADPAVTEPTSDTQPDTGGTNLVDELDVHNGEPQRPTFVDANGIERIAGPPVENWTPAQVEPTEEQIARNEAFQAREATRRDASEALLSQPTSEPLQAAQSDYHAELDAAGHPAVVETPTPAADSPDAAAQATADAAAQAEAERAQAEADAAAQAAAGAPSAGGQA